MQTAPRIERLQMTGIVKRFPGVLANDQVTIDVRAGEILALLGENGAGKSTLMKVLYGMYRPDAGEILINGRAVSLNSPLDAIGLGIGMVHQHFMLVPSLTVVENVVLGLPSRRGVLLDLDAAAKRIVRLSRQYGLNVNPGAYVWQLSVGQQQRVEILKALYRGADLLVLDEPTAVLTPQEAADLVAVLKGMAQSGLQLCAGEILGLAGVSGNGQKELAEVTAGLRRTSQGEIWLQQRRITHRSPARIMAAGLGYVPEDRLTVGTIPTFSVWENLILRDHPRPPLSRRGFLRFGVIRERCAELVQAFAVRTPSLETATGSLSGGNIQKVVLARETARQPAVLVAAYPTRGLDVGAIEYVHQVLLQARARGAGVLLIAEDLEEILALCDRIAVIYEGRIMDVLPAEAADVDRLGLLMAGVLPAARLST